jgi:hypothetical protein
MPPTYQVCNDVPTTPGGSFVWTNPFNTAVKIAPSPVGAAWPLTESFPLRVSANGTAHGNVQQNAAPNSYTISVTYDTNAGGNPCGVVKTGNPKIIVGSTKP